MRIGIYILDLNGVLFLRKMLIKEFTDDNFDIWFDSGLSWRCSMPKNNYIVCHRFTVDNHGKKMSKSLGSVIDPANVVDRYGVDVLR